MMEAVAGMLAEYSLQVLLLIAAAAILAAAVRLPAAARLLFWRSILVACLLFPLVPPRTLDLPVEPVVASMVAAGAAATSRADGANQLAMWSVSSFLAAIVVVGMALRATWLVVALIRLRRFVSQSEPAELNDEIAALQKALAPHAAVRWHAAVRHPATCGALRPTVLLPFTLKNAPVDIQRAVICHELVHVYRRDWPSMIVEEAVLTAFWFHPAMRWAIAQIQLNREAVVDAFVVELTGSRRSYMRALLNFADVRALTPATPFARRHIVARIKALSREVVMSPAHVAIRGAMLVVVLAGCHHSIASALPLRTDVRYYAAGSPARDVVLSVAPVRPEAAPQAVTAQPVRRTLPPPPPPPRPAPTAETPRPTEQPKPPYPPAALQYGVGARVTTHLTIDVTGTVVEAKATKWILTIDREIEDPGYWASKPERAFLEAAEETARRWKFAPLEKETGVDIIFEFRSKPSADKVNGAERSAVRVGGAIEPPMKIRDVRPVYPADARAAKIQGDVVLDIRVGADGSVMNATVVRSIPALDEAALAAVRQWQYAPVLLNGAPVDVLMTVTVQFVAN